MIEEIKLKPSPVVFIEDSHEYFMGEKKLVGCTTILNKTIFSDKYDGIPKRVLEKAAKKGNLIHKEVQNFEITGEIGETEEIQAYIKLKEKYDIRVIASEFLVSDLEVVATMIDQVGSIGDGDGMVDIMDIKTTYKLDKDYLSWQLSINAFLLEKQCSVKVRNLYGVYLRGSKAELVPIDRKSNSDIEELLFCYTSNIPYKSRQALIEPAYQAKLALLAAVEDSIIKLQNEQEELKKTRETFLKELEAAMEVNNVDKWETDRIVVTRVKPATSVSIDTKLLKELFPKIAESVSKETVKKGYLKIKVK